MISARERGAHVVERAIQSYTTEEAVHQRDIFRFDALRVEGRRRANHTAADEEIGGGGQKLGSQKPQ